MPRIPGLLERIQQHPYSENRTDELPRQRRLHTGLFVPAVVGVGVSVVLYGAGAVSGVAPWPPSFGPGTPWGPNDGRLTQDLVAPPTRALNRLLVIKALRSTLVVPVTTYSVTAEDPGGGELSYSWAMTATSPDGMCGTPHLPWTRTGSVVPWSHLMLPPDNCPHISTDHPVKAQVTIKVLTGPDEGATAVCDLLGSESQTITSPDSACRFIATPAAVPGVTTSATVLGGPTLTFAEAAGGAAVLGVAAGGLYYFVKVRKKNDKYHPPLGQFLTPDPSGLKPGPNQYDLDHQDPVNFVEKDAP